MNSRQVEDQRKIAAVYGLGSVCGTSVNENALKIWLMALEDFSAEQVEKGIALAIKTEEYSKMPVPAKIIRKIREACGIPSPLDQQKAKEAQAEAEWAQVLDQVRRVGSYGNPKFHPTTQRVLRAMGGWSALCESMTSANRDFKRRDFISMWQTYHETGDAMELGAFGVQQALAERMKQRPAEIPSGWLKRLQ
jgi:hypothetical protein